MSFPLRWVAVFSVALAGCQCAGNTRAAPALLSVEPAGLDFLRLAPGASARLEVSLMNRGSGALTLSALRLSDDTRGAFSIGAAPAGLAAGEQVSVTVTYTAPSTAGSDRAWLVIESDADNGPEARVSLLGESVSSCAPETCASLGKACGTWPDGCGGTLTCAQCTGSSTCDAAGQCACTAATCASLGRACGTWPDGCGGTLTCAQCTGSSTCDASGQCACAAATCASLGKACGTWPDGCGGTLTCAQCTGSSTCDAAGQCACPAATCTSLGKACGSWPDGCGGTLDCAQCTGSSTCDATGQCVCTPQTCTSLGKTCGSVPDGCGAMLSCGTCGGGQSCSANVCSCPGTQVLVGGVCRSCDVFVPSSGAATISAGILAAPSPGTVCVAPGTFTEDLTLRAHVSVYGSGVSTSVVGRVSVTQVSDVDPAPTTLSSFSLRSGSPAGIGSASGVWNDGRTFALVIENLRFTADQAAGTVYFGQLDVARGDVDVTVRDCEVTTDRGFRLVANTASLATRVNLTAERNRFMPIIDASPYNYDAFEFLVSGAWTTGPVPSAAGARVSGIIRNNEFFRSWGEAIYTYRGLVLQASDQAASTLVIAHNTFVCASGAAAWINNGAGSSPSIIMANNLYWGCASPAVAGQSPNLDVGNLAPAASPFLDVDAGDLHLTPGSPPIDAANPAWATSDDRDGLTRPRDGDANGSAIADVGAHEY